MNKEVLYGTGGIIIGVVLLLAIQSIGEGKFSNESEYRMAGENMMHEMMMSQDTSMHGAMNMMTNSLKGKTGEDFDKAFLSEMIVHHQGAIDMANLATSNAQHQEIKDLAKAIISAQTKEIDQMKAWQTSWFK